MILTLDVGNSNIVTIAYEEDEKIVYQQRSDTLKQPDFDFYLNYFKDLQNKLKGDVEKVMISCVVPKINQTLVDSAQIVFKTDVISINSKNVDLKVELDNPLELGADFIASAYGAMYQYPVPVIVIDMGTASKISVVGVDRNFLGGVILPGVGQMAESLSQNISHLPQIKLEVPDKVLGKNTIQCIQSGILHGSFLGLIEMAKQIEAELNCNAEIILTGGYVNLYNDKLGYQFNPNLINEGLYYLALEVFK